MHRRDPPAQPQPSSASACSSLPTLQVVVYTSSLPGCGCTGNVFVGLQGDKGDSDVLTLRNKGGSFRPGQVSCIGHLLGGRYLCKPASF